MYTAALTAFAILVIGNYLLKSAAPDGSIQASSSARGQSRRARALSLAADNNPGGDASKSARALGATEVSNQLASMLGLPSLSDPVEKEVSAVRVLIGNMEEIKRKLSLSELFSFENDYYGQLIKVVETFQGEIDHFDGSSALLVFGRLLQLDDHRESARGAAFAARKFLQGDFSSSLPSDLKAKVKVALSSGRAIAGPVGMDYRKVYTVFGGPIEELSSLLEEAEEG